MSTNPMTPDQWVRQLKKFNVPYREMPEFRNPKSGRDDETGLKFGPVFGSVIHHTGNDASDKNNQTLIRNGRSDLPGPLAHCGLNDNGVIDLITTGRANHAGGGDPRVLAAVKAENYGAEPPETTKHQGDQGAVDGNDSFYGLEAYYYKELTPAMYQSMVGWAAAIADFHGWTGKSSIGHKEWSDYKIDPNLISMPKFRADVDARIKSVNKGEATPDVKPGLLPKEIARAIASNMEYERWLRSTRPTGALPSIDEAIKQVRAQRSALRRYAALEAK